MQNLNEFLNQEIPSSKTNLGFLEIIRKQNHENINSSIYAHFINSPIESVKSLFVEALLKIINQKSDKDIKISNALATTEVSTGKGRIDILITDNISDHTIIIENKIHHLLNNDLEDYWNFIKIAENDKIGILLTREPRRADLINSFVNITHIEWITEVKNNLANYELPKNYEVYINDFISTIENISKNYKMNDSAKFYFENSEQILKAQATIFEARTFMNNQLEIVAHELGLNAYGNSIDWRNFWDENNHLDTYLTILIRDIMNGILRFSIIIELNRLDKTREVEIKNKFNNHPQFISKKRGESKGSYVHFLCAHYELSVDDLKDFGQFVVGKVRADFGDLFVQIIEYIYPDKDISAWKENLQVVRKNYITV